MQDFDKLEPTSLDYSLFKLIDDKSILGMQYDKLCSLLSENGVPPTRFPTMEHFISKLFQMMDEDKYRIWVEKYIELEGLFKINLLDDVKDDVKD